VDGSCEHKSVGKFLSSCTTAGVSRRAQFHEVSFFIPIPLIPYSYGVEVSHFSLDLYTIGRIPWKSDRPVARPLLK
jgi:hypothetical protein